MKIKFILFLGLIISSSLSQAGHVFVGNGGVGVRVNGEIQLLDLHEAGVVDPYVGSVVDAETLVQPVVWRIATKVMIDQNLLARKVSDLNRVRSGLGLMVLMALDFYTFDFTQKTLAIAPGQPAMKDPLVPLAVRYLELIVIAKEYLELAPEQRLALIVHEGLYSMAKARCQAGKCEQVSEDIRGLVAKLFLPNAQNDLELTAQLGEHLNIPELPSMCEGAAQNIQVGLWQMNQIDGDEIFGQKLGMSTGPLRLGSQQVTAIDEFCALPALKQYPENFVRLDLSVRTLNLIPDIYNSRLYGMQKLIRFELSQDNRRRTFKSLNSISCEAALRIQLSSWHSDLLSYKTHIPVEFFCPQ